MELYAGTTQDFVKDTLQNAIADKLSDSFFNYYGHRPYVGEVRSWRNSLRAMKDAVQLAGLDDHGILLEYHLPMSSGRIDVVLTGHDGRRDPNAVIVELKQWEAAEVGDGDHVVTWVGQGNRPVLHPSVQSMQYRMYLQDSHTAFYGDDALLLASCAYLHNYTWMDPDALLHPKYDQFRAHSPVFGQSDIDEVVEYLGKRLHQGDGVPLLDRVRQSSYRPSKKLMMHVADVIDGKPQYQLLDEQLVVFDQVLAMVRQGAKGGGRKAVVVEGGPGTGKSVVALNLLAAMAREGFTANYATGSRAFTTTLKEAIGRKGGQLFRYFNNYTEAEPGALDLVVCDEAHRIRQTSAHRFMKKADRPTRPQVEEILEAAKVSVFFIDDQQGVRHDEIGRPAYIREHAERLGAAVHDYKLDIQFRCMGSDAFVQWVDNTLGIRDTANPIWKGRDEFDFRILDTPQDVEDLIRTRAGEGQTARMIAGFCWPWSDPRPDGTLVDDVVIGDYKRPWNAKSGAVRLAEGIPKESLWAYDPRGIEQVGCIYTAQGFEFDYAGVIIGSDLQYDWETNQWRANLDEWKDRAAKRKAMDNLAIIKNVYRVLLSRGLKGCYITALDPQVSRFIASRTGP